MQSNIINKDKEKLKLNLQKCMCKDKYGYLVIKMQCYSFYVINGNNIVDGKKKLDHVLYVLSHKSCLL